MSTPAAKMLVMVGKAFACVKIVGRANFTSSIDFKTLLTQLHLKGYNYFVLDLSECMLMDSTFLGVLAGFGLHLSRQKPNGDTQGIELYHANPRIAELLENLGVLHLFRVNDGNLSTEECSESREQAPKTHSHEEITRACLEAHETLMQINPENVARFKDVAQFLAEDLKQLKSRTEPATS